MITTEVTCRLTDLLMQLHDASAELCGIVCSIEARRSNRDTHTEWTQLLRIEGTIREQLVNTFCVLNTSVIDKLQDALSQLELMDVGESIGLNKKAERIIKAAHRDAPDPVAIYPEGDNDR